MILYLDASALVKRYIAEPGSGEVAPTTPTTRPPHHSGTVNNERILNPCPSACLNRGSQAASSSRTV